MKIGKILAVAAVATVFASCSNEEESRIISLMSRLQPNVPSVIPTP